MPEQQQQGPAATDGYSTHEFIFTSRGIAAKFATDRVPESLFLNAENLEPGRMEGALSTRYGRTPVTVDTVGKVNTPLPGPVHTLGRLKSLNNADGTANTYRYAASGTQLYRRHGDTPGAYSSILSGLSGSRMALINYKPTGSSLPYLFISDAKKMQKDNGTVTDLWGIHRPAIPASAVVQPPTVIKTFDTIGDFTSSGFSSTAISSLVSTTMSNSVAQIGVATIYPASMTNIRKDMLLEVDSGANFEVIRVNSITANSFDAVCVKTHSAGVSLADHYFQGSMSGAGNGVVRCTHAQDLSPQGTAAQVSAGGTDVFRLGVLINGAIPTQEIGTPYVVQNGWGTGGHIGEYDGVWTMGPHSGDKGAIALQYQNAGSAFDGDESTCAYIVMQHIGQWGGCVWGFNYVGATPALMNLQILSEVPQDGQVYPGTDYTYGDDGNYLDTNRAMIVNQEAAGIWYSVDGGVTWTQVYFSGPRSKRWDQIQLPANTDPTQVQVMAFTHSHDDMVHYVYEIKLSIPQNDLSLAFDVGDGSFTDYYTSSISARSLTNWQSADFTRSSFVAYGAAGQSGKTWANVSAFKVTITANGALSFGLDGLYLAASSGPDVTGGSPYDYVYTLVDINTLDEGPPSPAVVDGNRVWPENQAVAVTWPVCDPAFYGTFTHYRIYRRGGSLPTGWTMISQVPIGTNSLLDTLSDGDISGNDQAQIDNYPPVTSTLRVPVNTATAGAIAVGQRTVAISDVTNITPHQMLTFDTLLFEETVVVQAVTSNSGDGTGAGTLTAYFQLPHNTGCQVYGESTYGKGCQYAALAFEQAWMYGDSENPGRLYYSKKGQVSSFPPSNYIDVSSPSDPIIGHIEMAGYLWVATASTWIRIYSPSAGSASYAQSGGVSTVVTGGTPQWLKTGLKHGMAAPFCAAAVDEGALYESWDGVYNLQGDELTLLIQWLFRNETTGPIAPADLTKRTEMIMAFFRNEALIGYVNINGQRKRLMYANKEKRWRNDDVQAVSMLVEEDTGTLVFGDPNGMIFVDRTGDVDNAGYSGGNAVVSPMSFTLQTEANDLGEPKRDKSFNELTLDLNTNGATVNVAVLFDNLQTQLNLGTAATTGRKQVQFNINSGKGYLSRNFSFLITGSVTNRVDLYEAHIRSLIDAEWRQSADSYWLNYGIETYKVIKQGWFEYSGAAAITYSCYIDGNMAAPMFSFTLPASTSRHRIQVRFPATKFRTIRWIATSTQDFKLYGSSEIEVKDLSGNNKGYAKVPLQEHP